MVKINLTVKARDNGHGAECACIVEAVGTKAEILVACYTLGKSLGKMIKDTPKDEQEALAKTVIEQMSKELYQ